MELRPFGPGGQDGEGSVPGRDGPSPGAGEVGEQSPWWPGALPPPVAGQALPGAPPESYGSLVQGPGAPYPASADGYVAWGTSSFGDGPVEGQWSRSYAPGRPAGVGWPPPSGLPVVPAGHHPRALEPAGAGRKPAGKLRRAWQRFVGFLAAAGAFLLKFGVLILKLKYLLLVVSMVVSIVAWSLFFGWTFAVGFVLLIFVHEMGHVIELRRQGVPASLPLFVPFMGAFVNMKAMPRSAFHEALSGLAGPYFGTAASIVVGVWGHAIGSEFLLQLAAAGFFVNLFNLMPMLPLDGGRAAGALHPALWFAGLIGLVVWEVVSFSPVVLFILVLGGLELWRRWSRRHTPASNAYHSLRPSQRWTIASLYVGVVVVALLGYQLSYLSRGVSF